MLYSVNRQTKEHRRCEAGDENSTVWEIVTTDADGWIPWEGDDECPLPDGHRCDVKHRDGEVVTDTFAGGDGAMIWSHQGFSGDIVGYRPVLDDTVESDDKWLPPAGCECLVSIEGGSYLPCKVIAYHEDMAWLEVIGENRHPVRMIDRCIFSTRAQQAEDAPEADAVEWNGEGLPPVGCECEYISNDTSWGTVRVIAYDGDAVVFRPSGKQYYSAVPSHRDEFRPISTPEQQAEDALVKVLEESCSAVVYEDGAEAI